MAKRGDYSSFVYDNPCPVCKAPEGEPCKTVTAARRRPKGSVCYAPHVPRVELSAMPQPPKKENPPKGEELLW